MACVSVVIPSRNEEYLAKTVDEVFTKATGDVECIVVLDAWWPVPILPDRKKLVLIHHSEPRGMREGINAAAAIAKGKYLMKLDAHCLLGEGYDEILAKDCQPDWLCVPSRYSLDAEKWTRGYGPLEYDFLTWPFEKDDQFGHGLHGKKFRGPTGMGSMRPKDYYYLERLRKDVLTDDIMSLQGSCWFIERQRFFDLGGMDTRFHNVFQEAQESYFKTFLSGGRVVVNKKTFYAHYHKRTPPQYGMSRRLKHHTERYSTWFWSTNQWPGTADCPVKRTFADFVAKFSPIPGWPPDWEQKQREFFERHPDWAKPPAS